jgi:hypothetical protein
MDQRINQVLFSSDNGVSSADDVSYFLNKSDWYIVEVEKKKHI